MKNSAINPDAEVREKDAAPSSSEFRGRNPELIVMLTHNDLTVGNAAEVFRLAKDSRARFWGFKEKPLPLECMKVLFSEMKRAGKTTLLEVVAYDEEAGLEGARTAASCGCDILMGTKFFPSIAKLCNKHGIRYMPFVGTIEGRPSVLSGSPDEMVSEAREALAGGAWGIDLLGYRYTGDAPALVREFVERVDAPVCVAGSIDCDKRLDEVKEAAPWAFTIGSAFFEKKFGDSFENQIDRVCERMSSQE